MARKRTIVRQSQRDAVKLARASLELASKSEGGAPAYPIVVSTAALVEPQAASMPCVVCDGAVKVLEHRAEVVDGSPLRVVHIKCTQCRVARNLYFKIAQLLN